LFTTLPTKQRCIIHVEARAKKVVLPTGSEVIVVCFTSLSQTGYRDTAVQEHAVCFQSIFEAAPDLVFVKDKDLRFIQVNPAMERILELDASEIIGKRAHDIYGAEAGEIIEEWDRRVLEGETVEEEHMVPAKGDFLTFHDVRMPLRDGNGDIIGVCGICRDITERKKIAPKLDVSTSTYPSRSMATAMELASQAAETDCIVLLQGESGTGKDHMAKWIHDHSRRSCSPFLTINCAAVPHEIAESELFGHEPGAFTGARNRKRGLLELAEGGTLLLNEIGELSPALQSKLLVFLDKRSFVRLGGEKSIRVNARILAASHRSLREEVAAGRFLDALFYRLNVFSIQVPALRERSDDIPVLASEIMAKVAKELHISGLPRLDPASLRALMSYEWPGNIRELRNVLERGMILWKRGPLTLDVPDDEEDAHTLSLNVSLEPGRTLRELVQEVTESICAEAVRRSGGNKRAAARALGVSRDSLYRHIKWLSRPEP
jgi:PAS domain S-box-containing protein